MTLALLSPWRRLAFLGLTVALLAAYVYSAAKACVASRLSSSLRLQDLQRAVWLQPSNARYHFLLANQLVLAESNPSAGLAELQAALALDPYTSAYWLALARVHLLNGDLGAQQQAIEHALQMDRTTPDVAWEAASFYVVQNEADKALPWLRVVIENQPDAGARAVTLAWRATHDAQQVMDHALPPRADAYLALLRQLVEAREAAAADRVWDHAYGLQQPMAPAGMFSYVQSLIENRRAGRARQVWRQLIERNPGLQAYQWSDNLVINGGFESELLNGGFDWRIESIPFVTLDLDSLTFHRGRQSLSVAFETHYPPQIGLRQYVPVEPNTRYTLRAFVKAQDLESASGPRFAVEDAYTHARLGISDETVGGTPWDQRSFDFTTGPDTSLVVLSVVRDPWNKIIRGKLWIDDVAITKAKD